MLIKTAYMWYTCILLLHTYCYKNKNDISYLKSAGYFYIIEGCTQQQVSLNAAVEWISLSHLVAKVLTK